MGAGYDIERQCKKYGSRTPGLTKEICFWHNHNSATSMADHLVQSNALALARKMSQQDEADLQTAKCRRLITVSLFKGNNNYNFCQEHFYFFVKDINDIISASKCVFPNVWHLTPSPGFVLFVILIILFIVLRKHIVTIYCIIWIYSDALNGEIFNIA